MSLDHHFLLVGRTAGPPPSGREIRARGIAIHDHVWADTVSRSSRHYLLHDGV